MLGLAAMARFLSELVSYVLVELLLHQLWSRERTTKPYTTDSRWPLVLAGLVLLLGAGVVVWMIVR